MYLNRYFVLFYLSICFSPNVYSIEICGSLNNGYGPYDYTGIEANSPNKSSNETPIQLVERFHLKQSTRMLQDTETASLMSDLPYILKVFPNHYPALWLLVKYDKKLGGMLPQKADKFPYTIVCFFNRAIRFKPSDSKVRELYGGYYHINKKYDKAIEQYLIAKKMGASSAEFYYNIGLTYFELGQYENARDAARIANKEGYPFQALQKKLKKRGMW